MRHEKLDNLLILALDMQASRQGVSLDDISHKFSVSRRTAMRMKDSILRLFPYADELTTAERTKRWRIPSGTLNRLAGCSADELADLETAITLLRRDNMHDKSANLSNLAAKLKSVMKPEVARRVEPDLEALLEAERLAMRPGPKPRNRTFVLEQLREAIKACEVVSITYETRSTRQVRDRDVEPYGFLYGHRHYLVARDEADPEGAMRLFSLPNISRATSTGRFYARNPSFDLEEFARRSFGIFQEDPQNIVWRFSARAARDARDFEFHPDQEFEPQKDGSLIVKFRSGGLLEMAWHLFSWGSDVEVLEPAELRELVGNSRPTWDALP